MAFLNGLFNVLRISVDSANNDQILNSASKRKADHLRRSPSLPFAGTGLVHRRHRSKGLLGDVWLLPVSSTDTGALDPNFTDLIISRMANVSASTISTRSFGAVWPHPTNARASGSSLETGTTLRAPIASPRNDESPVHHDADQLSRSESFPPFHRLASEQHA